MDRKQKLCATLFDPDLETPGNTGVPAAERLRALRDVPAATVEDDLELEHLHRSTYVLENASKCLQTDRSSVHQGRYVARMILLRVPFRVPFRVFFTLSFTVLFRVSFGALLRVSCN